MANCGIKRCTWLATYWDTKWYSFLPPQLYRAVTAAFLSSPTSLTISLWPLSHQQGVSVCRTAAPWMLFVFNSFSKQKQKRRDCCVWKSQESLRDTVCHAQSHWDCIFPSFWCLMWPLTEASDLYLHYFIQCTAATWLADWIITWVSRWKGVPNQVASVNMEKNYMGIIQVTSSK